MAALMLARLSAEPANTEKRLTERHRSARLALRKGGEPI